LGQLFKIMQKASWNFNRRKEYELWNNTYNALQEIACVWNKLKLDSKSTFLLITESLSFKEDSASEHSTDAIAGWMGAVSKEVTGSRCLSPNTCNLSFEGLN